MRYEYNLETGETIECEDAPASVVEPTPVKTTIELLSETDKWMSRISEDTVVALITDGIVSKEQYDPIVITRINYRRGLRGQPPI